MSTGKIRRIDYYPDEYISGVGGVLRADEQGVYWMVCSLIMSEGGPVQFDDRRMAGLCRLRPSAIKRIVGALVERGKLALIDGKLSQKRAQSELERASNRIQSAIENGSKGGRPRQKSQQNQQNAKAGGFSGEKLTNNYQPTTIEASSNEDASACAKSTPQMELGRVLNPEHVAAVIEYRKAKRSALTVHTAKLLANQLGQWPDPNAAADEMMLANWTGFKPAWMERRLEARGHGPPVDGHGRETQWQRQIRALEELDDEISPPASTERTVLSFPKPGTY